MGKEEEEAKGVESSEDSARLLPIKFSSVAQREKETCAACAMLQTPGPKQARAKSSSAPTE